MQKEAIPLELNSFVTEKLYHHKHFPSNAFSLLGEALKNWLNELLGLLGIEEDPKVLGMVSPRAEVVGRVFIEEGATVEPFAFIQGPAYIGKNAEVRHGAYLRGNTYVGPHCVVGHATEMKESVMLDHAKAGHFAYIGNSVLGRYVNLGAGTKLANLKLNKSLVKYKDPTTKKINSSGLKKFGSILGDHSQTGCNSVLSPGSLLMPHSKVLPCEHFHGTLFN